MKNLLPALTFAIFSYLPSKAQYVFRSHKYNYSIQIPNGFSKKPATGKNIDLKAVDNNGFSLIIVVKRLSTGTEGLSPHEMNSLSDEQLRSMLSEYGDNTEILAKENSYINGKPAFYIRYNHDELYTTSYTLVKGTYLYNISTSCSSASKAHMGPYFFRAIQSFKL